MEDAPLGIKLREYTREFKESGIGPLWIKIKDGCEKAARLGKTKYAVSCLTPKEFELLPLLIKENDLDFKKSSCPCGESIGPDCECSEEHKKRLNPPYFVIMWKDPVEEIGRIRNGIKKTLFDPIATN